MLSWSAAGLSAGKCLQISDAALQQLPEFRQRCAVMHQLGYADEDDTVQLKVGSPTLFSHPESLS